MHYYYFFFFAHMIIVLKCLVSTSKNRVLFFDVIQPSALQLDQNTEEAGQQAKFCYIADPLSAVYLHLVECILCRLRLKTI